MSCERVSCWLNAEIVQTALGPSHIQTTAQIQYSRIIVEKASECVQKDSLSLVWRWVRSDRTFSSGYCVCVINSRWQQLHTAQWRGKKGFNGSIPAEELYFSPSSFRSRTSCSKRPLWLSIISSSPLSDASPSLIFYCKADTIDDAERDTVRDYK